MWSECLLEFSLGFAENVPEKREKKERTSSERQQLRGGKRLVDDMGQRSEWAETGWLGTAERQQQLKQPVGASEVWHVASVNKQQHLQVAHLCSRSLATLSGGQ